MTIGQRIKEQRKQLGLSVDDIAEQLGKNRATIYRYESDEIENLSITILEPLAKVLKTTPAYLMGWEDDLGNKSEHQKNLEMLMDAAKDLSKDDILFAIEMIKKISKK